MAKPPWTGSMDWNYILWLMTKENCLMFRWPPGNVDDRKPVPDLLHPLFGQVYADKGYVFQKLFKELLEKVGIRLVTKLKRNMKQRLMPICERLMLRKRAVIETVIDQLKNISQIEHSRHRSPINCFVNILCGLLGLMAISPRSQESPWSTIYWLLLNPNSRYLMFQHRVNYEEWDELANSIFWRITNSNYP